MNTIIITGTSSGLGKAFFDLLTTKNSSRIICFSRRFLKYQVEISNDNRNIHLFEIDLNDIAATLEVVEKWLESSGLLSAADHVVFINNAATIEPIDKIGNYIVQVVSRSINVNFLAPILLTNLLIAQNELFKYKLTILNISTGAASQPIDGWGMYCSTKAATKMFFDVLNKQYINNPDISIKSIDPGVLDTPMQETIRSSECQQLLIKNSFNKLKENGNLKSPEEVAEDVLMDLGL